MPIVFDVNQERILRAAIDRIVPADDFPAAWDAGAADYIATILAGDLRASAHSFLAGLSALDGEAVARFGQKISNLSPSQQDELLSAIERGDVKTTWPIPPAEFFSQLVNLTMEGYYSNPSNGGNRKQISWKMVGYDPRGQTRSTP
jgi:gluconate 2-dehydrogenase gamma chain